jgi:hypothetical protein
MDYMVQERERGITITSGMSVIHMCMAGDGSEHASYRPCSRDDVSMARPHDQPDRHAGPRRLHDRGMAYTPEDVLDIR